MTGITPLLAQRWSPRSFDPHHELTQDELGLLLEAARWAPSGRNGQPWRFVLARRGDRAWTRIRPFVAGHSDWALPASLLVVNLYQGWVPSDGSAAVHDLRLYDLGGAVGHMVVQGQAMGLHARQFATFDREGLSTEFGVVAPLRAVTLTAFGLPLQGVDPEPRTRLPVADLLWPGSSTLDH